MTKIFTARIKNNANPARLIIVNEGDEHRQYAMNRIDGRAIGGIKHWHSVKSAIKERIGVDKD
jgi:hypothetical protein